MEEMRNQHDGPLVVDRDLAVRGLVAGSVTVRAGATLHLHGLIDGDLIAEADSIVVVHGMVDGSVINNGGEVTIYGIVDAVTGAHPSQVEPGAIVKS